MDEQVRALAAVLLLASCSDGAFVMVDGVDAGDSEAAVVAPEADGGRVTDAAPEAGEADAAPEAGEEDSGEEAGEADAAPEAGEADAAPEAGGEDAAPEVGEEDAGGEERLLLFSECSIDEDCFPSDTPTDCATEPACFRLLGYCRHGICTKKCGSTTGPCCEGSISCDDAVCRDFREISSDPEAEAVCTPPCSTAADCPADFICFNDLCTHLNDLP